MTSPSHLARPSRRQLITGAVLASAAVAAPAHAAPGGSGKGKGQDSGLRRDAI